MYRYFRGTGVKPQTFAIFAFHTDHFLVPLNWTFTRETSNSYIYKHLLLENETRKQKHVTKVYQIAYLFVLPSITPSEAGFVFLSRICCSRFLSIWSSHGQLCHFCHILWAIRCIINRLNTPHIATKKTACKLHEYLCGGQVYALHCTPLQ